MSLGVSSSRHFISGKAKNGFDKALNAPTRYSEKSYASKSDLYCLMLYPIIFLALVYYSNAIFPLQPVNFTDLRYKFNIEGSS